MLQIMNRLQSGLKHVALITLALLVLACPGEKGGAATDSAACSDSNATTTAANATIEQRLSEHFPSQQTIIGRITETGRVYVSGPALAAVSQEQRAIRFAPGDVGAAPRLIQMIRSCQKRDAGVCGNQYGCILCGAWSESDRGSITIDEYRVIHALQDANSFSEQGFKIVRFDDQLYIIAVTAGLGQKTYKEHLDNVPDRYF